MPIDGEDTRVGLGEEVDASTTGVRPIGTEGGHANPDDVLTMLADGLVVHAQTRQGRLAHVRDQHIGSCHQPGEYLLRCLAFQIQHEIPLAAVQTEIRRTLAIARRAEVTTLCLLYTSPSP